MATLIPLSVSVAADKVATPKASQPPGDLKLAFDSSKDAAYLTRATLAGLNRIESKTSLTKLNIGGVQIQAAGWFGKTSLRIGLDADGDGIVGFKEYHQVGKDGSVILSVLSEGKELNVRCTNVEMHYDKKKDEIILMRWRMQCLYSWIGVIDKTKIRIIDDNVDGKYSNDGRDAILIGDSKLAMPLRHYHKIGEHFYKLEIRAGGSAVKFQQIKFSEMGLVRSPLPDKNLLGLVLENGGGAFDIRACGKTGIPAGTYYLAYGVMGDSKDPLPFFRAMDMVKYEIQADKINMLRVGPPLQLVFGTVFQEADKTKKTPNMVGIGSPQYVMGASGELYGPISFPNARQEKGRPAIMIVQGNKPLVKSSMPQKNGRIGMFTWRIPEKLNLRNVKVIMAAHTQQLGKVIGMRTIKQIFSKDRFAPPSTDKPSVTATPWDKSEEPAADPKDPKVAKTDPKLKPKPKPPKHPTTRSRPPRPPKPPASNETKAGRLVKLARNYIKVGHRAKAVEVFKAAIAEYPDTKAAATARKLLESMK
jgi:hypothetical protein